MPQLTASVCYTVCDRDEAVRIYTAHVTTACDLSALVDIREDLPREFTPLRNTAVRAAAVSSRTALKATPDLRAAPALVLPAIVTKLAWDADRELR